jgi:hypothetical protein
MRPVETERTTNVPRRGTWPPPLRSWRETIRRKEVPVNSVTNEGREKERDSVPPPVISAPPEKELENKLRRNPENLDAKVDVGSDESMDASDPPSAAQPGCNDEPAPSSGFPEDK